MARTQTAELSPQDSLQDAEMKQDKPKTRRPPNTAFRQQRLKAWQPILTPKTVIPLFFAVGIIFAPLGGVMIWASNQVQEIALDYTDCATLAPETPDPSSSNYVFENLPGGRLTTQWSSLNSTCSNGPPQWTRYNATQPIGNQSLVTDTIPVTACRLRFDIPTDQMGPPVYMYYRLTKFYQNHRRYVKSLWQNQLKGDVVSNHTIDHSDCDPLKLDSDGFAYYPCGLIANSIFNDTIGEPVLTNVAGSDAANSTYAMTNKGIAWSSDKDLFKATKYTYDQVVPPPDWIRRYPGGKYSENFPFPDIHNDEAFQVWMRTAGLPTFSKMARRNDNEKMACGTYELEVIDEFPVSKYDGTKEILISTRTVLGGKNPFLGIAYVVVGGLCVILGAVFTATQLIKPRKLGDHTYLTWNNDQPSTATATGRSLRPNDAA